MGRLSAYAKNRILRLRFKKNKRIIHIVDILKKDDNIKVSRQAVSTFLKKYLETNSIYDKPRTGRKRKLTQEEIQLIGQVTRLNRDITARAIKEYLNLNVSTYTILRATKLFEWNKINPNSNDSKKAAALERQLNGGEMSGGETTTATDTATTTTTTTATDNGNGGKRRRSTSTGGTKKSKKASTAYTNADDAPAPVSASASPSAAASGKETAEASDSVVVQMTDDGEKETINVKSETSLTDSPANNENNHNNSTNENNSDSTADITEIERIQEKLLNCSNINNNNNNDASRLSVNNKSDEQSTTTTTTEARGKKLPHKNANSIPELEKVDLNILHHKDLAILKNLSCSPMSFATKILFKIFKIDELHGHNVSGKTLNKNLKAKLPLDPIRIGYIKFLVEKYYDEKECKEMLSGAMTHKQDLWKSCHTAINKSILISERKAQAAVASGKELPANDEYMLGGLDTSELDGEHSLLDTNSAKAKTKSGRKKSSKYDFESERASSSDSSSDDDASKIIIPKKYLTKKSKSAAAKTNGSLKKSNENGKRKKRFNSSSSTSSNEFDESLVSEDVESDPAGDLNESSSDDGVEKTSTSLKKVTNLIKGKMKRDQDQSKASRRSQRPRKQLKKYDQSDEDNNEEEDEENGVLYNDEDEDNPNEIELIQNIENRLTTQSSGKSQQQPVATTPKVVSNSFKLPIIKSNLSSSKLNVSNDLEDSEASAAANIAAAMKKRFVIVAPTTNVQTSPVQQSQQFSLNLAKSSSSKKPNSANTPENKKKIAGKNQEETGQHSKKPQETGQSKQKGKRGRPASSASTSSQSLKSTISPTHASTSSAAATTNSSTTKQNKATPSSASDTKKEQSSSKAAIKSSTTNSISKVKATKQESVVVETKNSSNNPERRSTRSLNKSLNTTTNKK